MEIVTFVMENLVFPVLVALIVIYIEKCFDDYSENQ